MLNRIQYGTDPVRRTQVGVVDGERGHDQAVGGDAPLPIPPAVEVGHQRAQVVGSLEGHAADVPAPLLCEPEQVVAQGGFEPPLGLRAVGVGFGPVPPLDGGVVAVEVLAHPVAALVELAFGGAADGTVLEHVPVPDAGRAPALAALHHQQGATRGEAIDQEPLVGRPQLAPLDAEVRQGAHHQPILVGVVHVVQLPVRVGIEQGATGFDAGLHRARRVVGVDPLAYRDQHGLRQPRRAQRGVQVDPGTTGRARCERRVPALRVLLVQPGRHLVEVDAAHPSWRDGLHRSAEDEDLLAEPLGQQVRRLDDRLEPSGVAECRPVLAAEVGGGGLRHGGRRVEVGHEARR
jgi:hypothetical protein